MRTFKRKIVDIDTKVNNISIYSNQLEFTGIVEDSNIFAVDQKSQSDALNVYVNGDGQLVSREPLVEDALPFILNEGDELIDIKKTNNVTIYIIRNTSSTTIIAYRGDESASVISTDYKLAIYNQYIICFRVEGAQVIDTNNDTLVWKSLSNFVDIPVTKVTTGPKEVTYDGNMFTDAYKEQYIRTNEIRTILPTVDSVTYGQVEYLTDYSKTNYSLYKPSFLSDYRIVKPINYTSGQNLSAANGILIIDKHTYCNISFDNGNTFSRISYPSELYPYHPAKVILTDNGKTIILLHRNGIYLYDIGNSTWRRINYNTEYPNINAVKAHCINENEFVIVSVGYSYSVWYIMHKGVLKEITTNMDTQIYNNDDSYNHTIRMGLSPNGQNAMIAMSELTYTGPKITTITLINNDTLTGYFEFSNEQNSENIITINNIELDDGVEVGTIKGAIGKIAALSSSLYSFSLTRSAMSDNTIITPSTTYTFNVNGTPLYIDDNIYLFYGNKRIYSISDNKYDTLPLNDYTYLVAIDRVNKVFYYSTNGNTIYTNAMSDNDIVTVTYAYNSSTQYKKVPNLTYSGDELFLAFDNELMITQNLKDGSNIKFNLPKINNQPFPDTITNIINISTTELAIFFEDNIMICAKEMLDNSYVYTYNKTRLSLGTRLGDDVINTLDGANTIFATIRGLAIMNYQAYMATTDQVLNFVSDNISTIWNSFYKSGSNIKLLQMKDYLFISNQTNEYLMLDLRTLSWWRFKIPVIVNKFITDQITLNIISNKLYKIDKEYNKNKYYDCDGSRIDWYVASQRLHFNAINHYKNLKQLVFQFAQANNFKNTINTVIKLYRKVITYKEPELIEFKIDEYRTFVKRFNYWKINEVQWGLSNDTETAIPAQLILNGIDIKYEIGEEVR